MTSFWRSYVLFSLFLRGTILVAACVVTWLEVVERGWRLSALYVGLTLAAGYLTLRGWRRWRHLNKE
ncbi:MAG: hypothetical protein N2050_01660 [Flavobacteriales bacterium]|nr:hypothetical protein [Flavobacteriales bacterium]MCX7649245.1 hypothetical protein [Flavobacteriales bacterium]MDW8431972.1 hypothetical protein [Flavobacteriales bacterium]